MPDMVMKWNGQVAEIDVPKGSLVDESKLVLSPSNYRTEINNRPDFAANKASDWIIELFKKGVISACRVEYGERIFLTPIPTGSGMDSGKMEKGFKKMVELLERVSKHTIVPAASEVAEIKIKTRKRFKKHSSNRAGEIALDVLDGVIDILTFAWLIEFLSND